MPHKASRPTRIVACTFLVLLVAYADNEQKEAQRKEKCNSFSFTPHHAPLTSVKHGATQTIQQALNINTRIVSYFWTTPPPPPLRLDEMASQLALSSKHEHQHTTFRSPAPTAQSPTPAVVRPSAANDIPDCDKTEFNHPWRVTRKPFR